MNEAQANSAVTLRLATRDDQGVGLAIYGLEEIDSLHTLAIFFANCSAMELLGFNLAVQLPHESAASTQENKTSCNPLRDAPSSTVNIACIRRKLHRSQHNGVGCVPAAIKRVLPS